MQKQQAICTLDRGICNLQFGLDGMTGCRCETECGSKRMVTVVIPDSRPEIKKQYIGDAVYAIFDGFGIELHVNDLENPTDKVYLEPSVLNALNKFYESCIQKPEEGEKTNAPH